MKTAKTADWCEAKPGSALARFMELRGRRILEAWGVTWHSVSGGFYMSLPYQATIEPDPAGLSDFLRKNRALGVRFPSLQWQGLRSGVYLRRRAPYDVSSVHPKMRSRVRRGLESCSMRPVDPDELFRCALPLNLDTMKRQGRYDPEFGEEGQWRRFTRAMAECEGVTAAGAFVHGDLAAYMILCRDGEYLHILHQMSSSRNLDCFPNHALTFSVTKQASLDRHLEFCCYGLLPLVDLPGLHEYKLRLGYELQPHRSSICLHPLVARAAGSAVAQAFVQGLRIVRPANQVLQRLETVVRGARLTRKQPRLEAVPSWRRSEKPQGTLRGD